MAHRASEAELFSVCSVLFPPLSFERGLREGDCLSRLHTGQEEDYYAMVAVDHLLEDKRQMADGELAALPGNKVFPRPGAGSDVLHSIALHVSA